MQFPLAAGAQIVDSEVQRFRAVTLTGGLEFPWGLAFLPDGRMLVTERPGRLRIVAADEREPAGFGPGGWRAGSGMRGPGAGGSPARRWATTRRKNGASTVRTMNP